MRVLTSDQIDSYLKSRYVIEIGDGVEIRIGEGNVLPEVLVKAIGDERVGVLLTAWNPFSTPTDERTNRDRNFELAERMRAEGRAFVTAFGQDNDSSWREDGFFVYPLTLAQAEMACVALRQHAVVAVDANGNAWLVFHPGTEIPTVAEDSRIV